MALVQEGVHKPQIVEAARRVPNRLPYYPTSKFSVSPLGGIPVIGLETEICDRVHEANRIPFPESRQAIRISGAEKAPAGTCFSVRGGIGLPERRGVLEQKSGLNVPILERSSFTWSASARHLKKK